MRKLIIRSLAAIGMCGSLFVPSVSQVAATDATTVQPAAAEFDFGDAPDGKKARYPNTSIIGEFPSLLESDGARTNVTNEIWLGNKVNQEEDSKQVDLDGFDDGAEPKLTSCATSKVKVAVQVANSGDMTGTGFVNLFFDWDRSGTWGGSDDCAAEWVVRNFPVDLSAQDQAIEVYVPEFTAGEKVNNIWWRVVLTKDQRLTEEDGSGSFESGEVEDYGPKTRGVPFGAYCDPKTRIIPHGTSTTFTIRKKAGSVPITFVGLANNMVPETGKRKITVAGNDVRYTPKKKHPTGDVDFETIDVRVRFGKNASIVVPCYVIVVHHRMPGVVQNAHDYTQTPLTSDYQVYQTGSQKLFYVNTYTRETFETEMIDMQLNGIQFPYSENGLPVPVQMTPYPNAGGNGASHDWTCSDDGSAVTCQGSTQWYIESFFDITFDIGQASLTPPDQLHLHLMSNGSVVGSVEAAKTE